MPGLNFLTIVRSRVRDGVRFPSPGIRRGCLGARQQLFSVGRGQAELTPGEKNGLCARDAEANSERNSHSPPTGCRSDLERVPSLRSQVALGFVPEPRSAFPLAWPRVPPPGATEILVFPCALAYHLKFNTQIAPGKLGGEVFHISPGGPIRGLVCMGRRMRGRVRWPGAFRCLRWRLCFAAHRGNQREPVPSSAPRVPQRRVL